MDEKKQLPMRLQYLIRSQMSNKGYYDNIREGQIEDLVKEAFQTQQEKRTAEIKVQQLEKQIEDLKLTSSDKLPRKKTKKEQEKELWDKNNPKQFVEYLKSKIIQGDLKYVKLDNFDDRNFTYNCVIEIHQRFKINSAVYFGDCITFGRILCWVKFQTKTKKEFEKWLKDNINMSRRQAERYINLVPLHDFPIFYRLATDLSSIEDTVDDIITYIGCNEKERDFWSK